MPATTEFTAQSVNSSSPTPNTQRQDSIQGAFVDNTQHTISHPEIANGDQTSTNEPTESDSLPKNGRTKLETTLIMGALSVSLFLSALDTTIITTAVPTIVTHFNSSIGYIWVGSAYLLGNAAVVPVWGKISDIFGRKQTLLVTVSVFLFGSLLCAISQSMTMLITARAIQGVGGGGTILLPNICVSDLFPLHKRGMYFGMLGMVWAMASALGPVIGGIFTSRVSWRWCFYINLPFGGVALATLTFFLKLHNPRTPIRQGLAAIDWIGNLLVVGGTLMILIGLQFGGIQYAWKSATIICLLVFGAITIAIFCFYESKFAKYPVIPPRIFYYRNSISAYSLSVMHAMAFLGGTYWLPMYFQSVLGADSLMSGVYLLPYVISSSLASIGAGVLIKKTGNFRLPIVIGLFVMTIGLGLLTYLDVEPHWDRIILFQIIAGIGSAPNFQAPLIAIQTNIEPRDIGVATSSFSFARQIGTSISVTIGGVVFNNVMASQRDHLASVLGQQLAEEFSGQEASASIQKINDLPMDQIQTVRTAYWNALQKMFILYACVSFTGLAISLWIKQTTLAKEHTEHKTGLQSLKMEDRQRNKKPDEERLAQVKSANGNK
ncbi:major facilitator superfamily-domain-containing protein [Talaromyces proteolyticus]|uniref:Efflux pump dotC n=1 Tax=Talaromyces proteolyticus TaxID=1131652 RepID=A0AAD4Q626_9EURO|nr:major facilitator superfamily-domain-containing protein [Talaromyces proteolyticus]KAH8704937.1 major facilitator superfamily-domain-containing protein [Talaromyces proteolyticus]